VIAVEASQENANLIRYSLCLNPELKSRIKLHHVALAETRMRCTMASPEGNVGENGDGPRGGGTWNRCK